MPRIQAGDRDGAIRVGIAELIAAIEGKGAVPESAAGAPQMTLHHDAGCLEVMTGAVMPLQADTVIRYEDLDLQDGMVTVLIEDIAKGQNIHVKGIDRKAGEGRRGKQIIFKMKHFLFVGFVRHQ